MTAGAWLTLLRSDVEVFAKRLTDTADLVNGESADANYWFLSSQSRSAFGTVPTDFMVGSIADDLKVLGSLHEGGAPDKVHLEAIASILLYLAAREEQA